ncbi:OmpH family outer membrane protein [Arsenophonus nasoniae]|uniref:Chaperone protein Skp n=1 Tax=Arsenophonus nasoniae TaxID=638 RepID=D2U256_9GAMM|nr:OmpH family outer membrane protein [Arsenophonus nasoniae]QBY42088.1 Chaperone protein Skp [Arsenophonus nasoniae]WGM06267.1 OmpH family outer membrane protein [Arsenophonus nasoniae]WGM11203.1 OmpH family outer membrane protein [Arsenophonus nasoniae]WGM15903.1 OmpH family outer membrane protein [Arsenophonus nasoniae]CBA75027.1 outer membrane protein [Arsenophonus nasoniae]
MKKLLCAAGLGLILSVSTSAYAEKIAVINVGEVFQDIATKKAVSKQLEKEFKGRANELQNMEKDLQTRAEKLQKNAAKPNEKDLQAFEAKRTDFLKKAQQFEQDNQRRQQEERNKILQTIKTATKAVAEKERYDVVVDASTVLYPENSSNLKNITDLVIKKVK